jgi:hypothetical protein
LRVTATVVQTATGGWQLRFDASSGSTSARVMNGDSCAEMADAAALLLALLVDPNLEARSAAALPSRASSSNHEASAPASAAETAALASEAHARKPERSAPQTNASAAEPRMPAGLATAPAESRARAWPSLEIGAEFAVWAQRLPSVAPGVALSVGARFARARALATVGYFPALEVSDARASADIGLGTAGVVGAYRLLKGPVELDPFLGIDVQLMHASRLDRPESGRIWLLGFGAGLSGSAAIGRGLSLQASAQAQLLAARPGFVVGSDSLHRPATLGFRFGVGAVWVTGSTR